MLEEKNVDQITITKYLNRNYAVIYAKNNVNMYILLDNIDSFINNLGQKQAYLNYNKDEYIKVMYEPNEIKNLERYKLSSYRVHFLIGLMGVAILFYKKSIFLFKSKVFLDPKIYNNFIKSNKRKEIFNEVFIRLRKYDYNKTKDRKTNEKKKEDDNNNKEGGGFLGGLGGLFDVGKIKTKEYGTEEKISTKFIDVAGMQSAKEEIIEFVDFLKNPDKYHNLGAKIPRGALLVGPPGTGKTLLAKSVAGEAEVPFFSVSGSDFVEKYVGVGASRVRDLFKKARNKSPSIIFIDEIDAVGKKRGGQFMKNDERDSTLNQLLVEMDGFNTTSSVVVLAATNRADVLDNALLRPGRFDRQVEVNLPDREERIEILKIYLNKIVLDNSISLNEYAERLSTLTPGYSGAELSNLVNEAAILAAREEKENVNLACFEKASERVLAGLETNRNLSKIERETVAYHEAGHAIIGWFLKNCSPVVKITIIPRSKGSLGFTQYIPDEQQLMTKEQILDSICMTLGGRMAEELFFNKITSGASDDLQKVTQMAKSLVSNYGMSSLGYRVYEISNDSFTKNYSEETDKLIDEEVNKIIEGCISKTRELVRKYKSEIEKVSKELLEKDTIDILDISNLIGSRPYPMPKSIEAYIKEMKDRKKKLEEETSNSKSTLNVDETIDSDANNSEQENENNKNKN